MIITCRFDCAADVVGKSALDMFSKTNPRIKRNDEDNSFTFQGEASEVVRVMNAVRQLIDITAFKL